jgi:hypothetical protein
MAGSPWVRFAFGRSDSGRIGFAPLALAVGMVSGRRAGSFGLL